MCEVREGYGWVWMYENSTANKPKRALPAWAYSRWDFSCFHTYVIHEIEVHLKGPQLFFPVEITLRKSY